MHSHNHGDIDSHTHSDIHKFK